MPTHQVSTLIALIGACGSGTPSPPLVSEGSARPAFTETVPPTGGPVGPRPLPPTIVPLELDRFPRPAAEACAGDRPVVAVAPPASIGAAIAAAAPGTTIEVAPGVYHENTADYYALGWETPRLCVRAAGGGTVVLEAAPGQKYGVIITGDDTVIEGFTLRGFEANVSVGQSEGRTQRRVTLERLRIEAPTGESREGVIAYGDNQSAPGRPPTLDGLLLLDVQTEGMDISVSCNAGPCAHWWIERAVLRGRRGAESSGADAFAIEDGRQIAVVDSVFADADADGIDTKAEDVVVFGARVLGVGRNGVKLWHGGDVIDTVLDGTGADAALVGDQPGTYRYLHVLVANHGGPGAEGYVGTWGYDAPRLPGYRLEIANSIFWRDATGGLFAPAGATVSLRNNLFAPGDAKLFELSDGSTFMTADLAAFEASGRGAGNRLADPGFADGYATRPGSPARDAAAPVAGLARDLDGNPRARGAGPDIGPVETAP